MNPSHDHYAGHRFPAEIISHTVWLYFRFTLGFRDIEELMASRGVILTYESIRQWCLKFGQVFANEIRRRQPKRGDKWYDRQEGPQAWKVDFTAKRQAALGAAAPHWQKADTEKNAALALGKAIRETESALATVDEKNKAKLQQQLRDLKAGQQAREQAAKLAQAEGDALYWPIYNLDIKNPHAKARLEHADPKDLIASMRSHEAEVMRQLGEIEALVAAVQA